MRASDVIERPKDIMFCSILEDNIKQQIFPLENLDPMNLLHF